MKEEKLKELLERYYNGNTSDEEEFLLKEYFSGNDILPGYEAETEIFRFYSANERMAAPSDKLESSILDSIDYLEEDRKLKKSIFKRRRIIIISAAASLLILAGSYFFFISRTGPKDTYNDPRIAYAEAKRILYDVSVRLNRGTQTLQNTVKTAQKGLISVEKSANLISGQFEIIENIGKIIDKDDQKK